MVVVFNQFKKRVFMEKSIKSLLLLGLGLLGVSLNMSGMIKPTPAAPARWKGRAIPMALDPNTGKWRVLLGHRPLSEDPNDVWADFDEASPGGQHGNVVAAHALAHQTNNVYAINPRVFQHGVQVVQDPAGDWFQFIPVGIPRVDPNPNRPASPDFIPGQYLYNNATNVERDNFIWADADDIIHNRPIMHRNPVTGKQQKITISRGVHAALRQLLPGAIEFFDQALAQAPAVAAPAPVPVRAAPAPAPIPAPVRRPVQLVPVTRPKPAAVAPAPAPAPIQAGAPWGPRKPGHIYFYDKRAPYYEFTNFYESPVNIGGQQWRTTEHYFQFQKYPDNPNLPQHSRDMPRQIRQRIANAGTASEVFE